MTTRVKSVLFSGLFVLFLLLAIAESGITDEGLRYTPTVNVVQKAAPAVVNVHTEKVVSKSADPFKHFFGSNDLFSQFFDDHFGSSQKRQYVQKSLGSGVIINGQKRLVLTNSHVITGASSINVRLLDGRSFEAELVGSDPDFDLAVLQLSGEDELPEISMGNSENILIGEKVIAIGNPYGFSHTVTTGVISALGRSFQTEEGAFTDFIQTDAAINPGNSGGPILNIKGELIGINTAIHAKAQGIGFAIPINKARRVVEEILSYGHVQPIWLGLSGQNLNERIAGYLELDTTSGMLISEVYSPSPAARQGISSGNVLLKLNSVSVKDKEHYLQLLRNITQGEEVELKIWVEGENETFKLKASSFETDRAANLAWQRWGISVTASSEQKGCVVQEIRPGSPADNLGLRSGDLLYKIAGQVLKDKQDFISYFMRYRMQENVLFLVGRNGQGYYVRLRM
jgi:Do/DeqQ family serine protease